MLPIEIERLIALLGTGDSGSSKKPPCMDGTRVSLLKWISRWIQAPAVDDRRGLCLIGAAGRGKSSIGASVAEDERTSKRLGADFYFTIYQQDRNEGVIPVLARQLASWGDGRLRVEIASALHADRDLAQRLLEVQFRKLIQEPLETLADDPDCPTLVILLDGLDECNNEYATRLLHLIGQGFTRLPSAVKFIITSRPELHLLHLYDRDPLEALLVIRSLDSEDVGEVQDDIKEYFKRVLPQMVWDWVKNPSNWPDEERLEKLVSLSGNLWIWAATVTRMLADSNIRDPERQLDVLLSEASDPQQEYGRISDLDVIYSKILDRACPPTSNDRLFTAFRDVLGALCVTKVPVNIKTLASLLYLDHTGSEDFTHYIRTRVLGYLQAVLVVPDVDEEDPSHDANPIRFIHKSFQDYLTGGSLCGARFLVDVVEQHRRMAIRCIRRMDDLKRPNICDINPDMITADEFVIYTGPHYKFRVKAEVKNLVQQHISPALRYACENWTTHVSNASPDCDDVYAFVDAFVKTKLLYWLEVLSLLGIIEDVRGLVDLVEAWLKARPQEVAPNPPEPPTLALTPTPTLPYRVSAFMMEGLVKILAVIHLQTAAVYTPTDPLSALNYAKRVLPGLPPVQNLIPSSQASTSTRESNLSALDLLQDLKSFIDEFEVPIGTSSPHIYRSALAFTPPQTSLSRVYGHLVDGGPRIRRGRPEQWSNRSCCATWSPNSQRIVSGSKDGTLRLWDPPTGSPIGEPWKFHTGKVNCVAWSPDGKMIVSGSDDRTLQLWDAITGARVQACTGHNHAVLSVAWSPDGTRIVSGSADCTLRIWDPSAGVSIGEAWNGHVNWIQCVAWSPDSKKIASGSRDHTIRVWDSSTGAVIGEPWSEDSDYGLAWSPDGKRIISAAQDDTLRLWDVCSRESIGNPWKGHDDAVLTVAWSLDGKRIISGGLDNTIRVWNASTGETLGDAWEGHADYIKSLSWSPDGKTIVSASNDGKLITWNSITGEPFLLEQRGPESHARHVYRLAFAHDASKLVSASSDDSLRLWDISSGALSGYPLRQAGTVTSLEFSPSGQCVVAEDEEHRIIWEIAGEAPESEQRGLVSGDHERILEVDWDGWILDPQGKMMFWLPVALRPIADWGRVLAKGNILAIENPSVPIIDISAFASRM
ncbi:hypothetical protein FRB93_011233 [Tulasnella sp. JGI-2019a]|nr:hypothetical protein FRB93_011233 [Tulasnella sp. JGI-2019a]